MTDLRQAAEMALKAIDEGWLFEDIDKTVAPALRQALAEWTPDDTAYRPDGLSQEELIKISSEYLTNGMAFMKAGKHVPVDEVINRKEDVDEPPPVKSYCGGKPNYCEPEMPVDRGAWSDVPDATKWVDELRGDEPSTDLEPEPFLWYSQYVMDKTGSHHDAILPFKPHDDGDWIPLYTAPPVANVNTSE